MVVLDSPAPLRVIALFTETAVCPAPQVNEPAGMVIVSPGDAATIFAFTSACDPLLANVVARTETVINPEANRSIINFLFIGTICLRQAGQKNS